MVEGASPPGGVRGPAALGCRPVRFRITPDKLNHLTTTHRAHSSAVALLAESPLKARLSEKLSIAKVEIELLGRRMSAPDAGQPYRLEDLFDSVRLSLNSVRDELLEAVRSSLGQQIPELVPEALEEPPPPIPVPLTVTPKGAEETPFQKWHKTLDVRQIQALEYLRGFERGEMWEKIYSNRIIMHESAKLSGRPINLVLTAIADLMECRVKGLPKLLSGLAESCSVLEEAGIPEAWGGIHEVIRLARLAKAKSTAGPLTEAHKGIHGIKYYREEFKGGRITAATSHEIVRDLEFDGYREKSRTGLEIKSSEDPIKFNNREPQAIEWELRFRNQARASRAAVRSDKLAWVEYHLTAPEVDVEVLLFLNRTIRNKEGAVRVRIFYYKLLTEWEGMEQVVIDPLGSPATRASAKDELEPVPPKNGQREWDEAAWVWALAKYPVKGSRFKGFDNKPINLRKRGVRQPHTEAIINGLQKSLDQVIQSSQQEKTAKAMGFKQAVAAWKMSLDKNSLSIDAICEFSLVLTEIREFLGD